MFKLIMLTMVGSYIGLLGVKINGGVQQLASYDTGTVSLSAIREAVLTGALVPEGLVVVNTGQNGLKGLYVSQNYGFQHSVSPQVTANVHILEPKVSDAYLQYGNTPLVSAPYDPSLAEDVKLVQ